MLCTLTDTEWNISSTGSGNVVKLPADLKLATNFLDMIELTAMR